MIVNFFVEGLNHDCEFFLDNLNNAENSGFELGGIELLSNGKLYKLENSDEYFMVFPSISIVLENLLSFVDNKFQYKYLMFIDSSFDIRLNKKKSGIEIYTKDLYFDVVDEIELLKDFYYASVEFYNKNPIPHNSKSVMILKDFYSISKRVSLFISK